MANPEKEVSLEALQDPIIITMANGLLCCISSKKSHIGLVQYTASIENRGVTVHLDLTREQTASLMGKIPTDCRVLRKIRPKMIVIEASGMQFAAEREKYGLYLASIADNVPLQVAALLAQKDDT